LYMRSTRKRKTSKRFIVFIAFIVTTCVLVGGFFLINGVNDDDPGEETADPPIKSNTNTKSDPETSPEQSESELEEGFTDIRIAAAGDIMFHETQLESAYDEASKTYDFTSMFED